MGFGILVVMAGASALLLVALMTGQAAPVAKIQVGDKLRVVVTEDDRYNGEYVVLDDGSLTGVGFGRLVVAGKTVEETRILLRNQFLKILRSPTVSLVIVEQKPKFVFVTSLVGVAPGPIPFEPELDIRRAVSGVSLPVNSQEFEVRLFRDGNLVGRESLERVLKGVGDFGSTKLKPNDVVTLAEVVKHRIYVGGRVLRPGEFQVLEGTDALQALALAGGTTESALGEIEYSIEVRRGTNVFEVSDDPKQPRFTLEAGDTVLVSIPERIRVSIGGEVGAAGQQTLRKGSDLFTAIQRAGGVRADGSLADVLVIRGQESFLVDLSLFQTGSNIQAFPVEDGDLIFVRRNERRFLVVGNVARPRPVPMLVGREYRLADAVTEAGGPDAQGTTQRVYVGRRGESGKVEVKEYQLAAFLKDGDMSQNPEILPGDIVLVGERRGLTIGQVSSLLSSALLIDSLFRR
ncbi:hypothetical protein CCB80_12385 [Armatimonadetes bacterium Uphvl-Ar1]|nr:hypothetical protein CCB80_12385 [Armatimonadetes bacterium Uphvl-Ar1]